MCIRDSHRIEEIEGTQGNEFNVFYVRKKLKGKSINLNYNTRYLRRVFQNRTYLKDDIKDFILRLYNRFSNWFYLQFHVLIDNQLLIEMIKKYTSKHIHHLNVEQVLS